MGIQNLAGQTLGNYELLELIGEGGMGAVYSAVQLALKRKVAVKVLSHELVAEQPSYIERFNREAHTAARLEHAHIIPVYDYGTIAGTSFVVMRLLTGGTLLDRLEKHMDGGEPLASLEEISAVLGDIASALDYAHSQDVIHRDIKPSNIMFDNQGSPFIVDFGIAKLMTAQQAITKSGVRMGTPTHMAPEQWRVETVVPATDQYALGVITYSMVTGRVPFEAVTPYALMNKHLNETPTPPRMFRPNTSSELEDVLARAMAKEPADRFPSCTTFVEAFTKAVTGTKEHTTGFFRVPDQTTPALPPKQPRPHTPTPHQTTPPGSVSRPSHPMRPEPSTEHAERRQTATQRQITPSGRQSTPPGQDSRPSRPDSIHVLRMAPDPAPFYRTREFWLIGLVVVLVVIGALVVVIMFSGNDDGSRTELTPEPTIAASPSPVTADQPGGETPSSPKPTQPVIVVEASPTPGGR